MTRSKIVGSFEAKTHFSEIMQQVHDEGIEYIITNRGVPIARILPYEDLEIDEVKDAIEKFKNYKKKNIKNKIHFNYLEARHHDHKY